MMQCRRMEARRTAATRRGSALVAVSILVANSTHPLRLVSWLGLALSGLNALYAVYVLLVWTFSDNVVPGWATRSIQTSVMFFFTFLLLTVLCEYIGRILSETQNRPLYYVGDELNSSSLVLDEERRNVTSESV